MPVDQMEVRTAVISLQNQSFAELRHEDGKALRRGADKSAGRFCPVMIAPEHVETPGHLKLGKLLKHITVNLTDVAPAAVFPELVAIAQLDVGETIGPVVFQGGHVKALVLQEAVVPGAAAPVAVAEQNDFRVVGSADDRSILQSLVNLAGKKVHGVTSLPDVIRWFIVCGRGEMWYNEEQKKTLPPGDGRY